MAWRILGWIGLVTVILGALGIVLMVLALREYGQRERQRRQGEIAIDVFLLELAMRKGLVIEG